MLARLIAEESYANLSGRTELSDILLAMMMEYDEWAISHDDFEVVHTEQPALVPIRDPGGTIIALYYVKFDGLIVDNRGRRWIFEHKTCGNWWTPEMLLLDEQVSAYCWAYQQWSGQEVAGVVMNFLKKERIKEVPCNNGRVPTAAYNRLAYVTAAKYRDALDSFYGTRARSAEHEATYQLLLDREFAAGHPTIRREIINRPPEQIAQQGHRILADTQRLLTTEWADNMNNPTANFLCSSCGVKDLCQIREQGLDWFSVSRTLYNHNTPAHFMEDLDGTA